MPAEHSGLPVRVAPAAGESLESWLERLAAGNTLTTAQLLADLGISSNLSVLALPAPTIQRLAQRTRVDHDRIHAATLAAFDGHGIDLDGFTPTDPASYRQVAARGWAPAHGTQLCPRCLADHGVWLATWRTPYAAICIEHGTYLLTRCPGCSRPFRDQRHSLLRPSDAHDLCGNPIGAGPRQHCRTQLTELATAPAPPPEVATQQRIHAALSGATVPALGTDLDGGDYLRELRALTVLLLHLAAQPTRPAALAWVTAVQSAAAERTRERGPRWGIRPPDDPVARAGAFTVADAILTAPDGDAAGEKLTPWLDRVPAVREGVLGWLADRTQMTKTLSSLVIRAHAPHRRLSHLLDQTVPMLPAVCVPQVIPQQSYHRHLTGLFGASPDTVRLFAAICLARTITSAHSWADAGDLLGLPAGMAEGTARACSARALVPPHRIINALSKVAADLPHVDRNGLEEDVHRLRRRRTWFERFCAVRPGTLASSKGYAITWIWVNVTGGHMLTSPGWTRTPTRQERALYRQFAGTLRSTQTERLTALIPCHELKPEPPAAGAVVDRAVMKVDTNRPGRATVNDGERQHRERARKTGRPHRHHTERAPSRRCGSSGI